MICVAVTVLSVLAATPADTQSAAAAEPRPAAAPVQERPGLWIGLEPRLDRLDYRFENPSSFDTAVLVPHFYEQTYVYDNLWVSARGRWRFAGRLWQTEFGITPEIVGRATDHDTFYQPDGSVVVYGTSADATMRSWRLAQYIETDTRHGFTFRGGYSYRRDRSVYHASYSTTERDRPPLSSSVWNEGRETTVSEVHGIWLGTTRQMVQTPRWDWRVTVDVSPATLARLSTLLPDKYPNQPAIVGIAKGLSVDASAAIQVRRSGWSVGLTARYTETWSYGRANAVRGRGFGIVCGVGRVER